MRAGAGGDDYQIAYPLRPPGSKVHSPGSAGWKEAKASVFGIGDEDSYVTKSGYNAC